MKAVPFSRRYKNPSFSHLPLYGWKVEARKKRLKEEDLTVILHLSQTGEVWKYFAREMEQPGPIRESLILAPTNQEKFSGNLDSTSTDQLTARFWALNTRVNLEISGQDSVNLNFFDNVDAIAIAQHYLDKSLLRQYNLNADSVTRPDEPERDLARVVFNGDAPGSSIPIRAEFFVDTAGALRSINTIYAPAPPAPSTEESNLSLDFGFGGISDMLLSLGYLLLILFSFILFFTPT